MNIGLVHIMNSLKRYGKKRGYFHRFSGGQWVTCDFIYDTEFKSYVNTSGIFLPNVKEYPPSNKYTENLENVKITGLESIISNMNFENYSYIMELGLFLNPEIKEYFTSEDD